MDNIVPVPEIKKITRQAEIVSTDKTVVNGITPTLGINDLIFNKLSGASHIKSQMLSHADDKVTIKVEVTGRFDEDEFDKIVAELSH